MKRLFSIICSLLLIAMSVLTAMPVAALGSNLVQNPSLETNASGKPTSWASDKWGTNTTTFSYANSGSHSGTYSVTTNMTTHASGDAKWYFAPVTVSPNTAYVISDWFKSTTSSDLDVVITTSTGATTYFGLDTLASSANAWKQTNYTFTTPANAAKMTIYHSVSSVGQITTDDYSVADQNGTTPTPTPTPTPAPTPQPTAPTVSMTAPAANSSVSGTVAVSANATDAQAVTSVQFKVDGASIGAPDTTAPYSINWDSKSIASGSHTLSAVATNTSNMTSASGNVVVTVNNTVTPPPVASSNLLANPSVETTQDANTPASWISSSWGTNTSTFSYPTTGHTGSRSIKVQTTNYTDGAANWFYNEVPVTAGKTYQYSNWYQSNVDTEVDAQVTMNDGTVQYFWLGNVFANAGWTQYKTTFTPPAGAKSIAIYQILAKVGYIVSDDYSLSEYTPLPYNRALVSVTFDDGWTNQYTNAYPVLQQLGIKSTFYIISGSLTTQPDYMTGTQVKNLYASGHEIGSHTITHSDMTTLGATKLKNEFAKSQTTLQNLIGAPVTNFAYPYGSYNQNTINVGKQYYASQRSVIGGLNTRDSLDVTQLKIQEVDSNISTAQVRSWIDSAITNHAWLILTYHEVANTPAAPDDALYTVKPSDFSAQMNYLKSSGAATATVRQALAEVQAQP